MTNVAYRIQKWMNQVLSLYLNNGLCYWRFNHYNNWIVATIHIINGINRIRNWKMAMTNVAYRIQKWMNQVPSLYLINGLCYWRFNHYSNWIVATIHIITGINRIRNWKNGYDKCCLSYSKVNESSPIFLSHQRAVLLAFQSVQQLNSCNYSHNNWY